jgi:hypothetical protein
MTDRSGSIDVEGESLAQCDVVEISAVQCGGDQYVYAREEEREEKGMEE